MHTPIHNLHCLWSLRVYTKVLKGLLEQLSGPNFTQFWPPLPRAWSGQLWTFYMISSIYPLSLGEETYRVSHIYCYRYKFTPPTAPTLPIPQAKPFGCRRCPWCLRVRTILLMSVMFSKYIVCAAMLQLSLLMTFATHELRNLHSWVSLKVRQFRKKIVMSSILPKNWRKISLISGLTSKKWLNKK